MENEKVKLPEISPKSTVRFIVGRSVSLVIASAIASLVPAETKIKKVQTFVGAFVIGSMVADQAGEWSDAKYDEISEAVKSIKEVWDQYNNPPNTVEKDSQDLENNLDIED